MDNQNDMFGGLTAEEIKALLATNGDPAKLQELQSQQATADKLRAGAFESHPGHMAGNVYVGDIAGSLLGGLGAIKGNLMDKQATKDRDALYANQAQNSQAFINALMRKNGQPGLPPVNPLDKKDELMGGGGQEIY